MDFQEARSTPLSRNSSVFNGKSSEEQNPTSYARSRILFKDWDAQRERERVQKIISKEKEVTMDSMLGYYPYTLFQTLTRKGDRRGGSLHRPTSSIREEKRTPRQGHEEPLPQGNQEYKLWGKELISESKRGRTYLPRCSSHLLARCQ